MLDGVIRRRIPLPDRGVELALLDWGRSGPLAVLHHANGFCGATWGPIAERLRHRFRVVAYDARGHGDSSRPSSRDAYRWRNFPEDLVALADRLTKESGGGRVSMAIGHSFGGTSAAAAAAHRPDLFERVVLLDPVLPPPGELPSLNGTSALAQGARARRHVWPSYDEVLASWTREGHPFSMWDRRALELYVHEGFRANADGEVELKCPGDVEATIFEMNRTMDMRGDAPHIRAPVLLVRGTRSHFPREAYRRLVESIPDARYEEVEAGHLLVMETPDRVADSILRFADGEEAVAAARG